MFFMHVINDKGEGWIQTKRVIYSKESNRVTYDEDMFTGISKGTVEVYSLETGKFLAKYELG